MMRCCLQAPFLQQILQKPSVPGGWWTGTAILLVLYCVYEQICFAASRSVARSCLSERLITPTVSWPPQCKCVIQAPGRFQISTRSAICCPSGWLYSCHGQKPLPVLGRSKKVGDPATAPGLLATWAPVPTCLQHTMLVTPTPALTATHRMGLAVLHSIIICILDHLRDGILHLQYADITCSTAAGTLSLVCHGTACAESS